MLPVLCFPSRRTCSLLSARQRNETLPLLGAFTRLERSPQCNHQNEETERAFFLMCVAVLYPRPYPRIREQAAPRGRPVHGRRARGGGHAARGAPVRRNPGLEPRHAARRRATWKKKKDPRPTPPLRPARPPVPRSGLPLRGGGIPARRVTPSYRYSALRSLPTLLSRTSSNTTPQSLSVPVSISVSVSAQPPPRPASAPWTSESPATIRGGSLPASTPPSPQTPTSSSPPEASRWETETW